ncbi:hypothetical protein BGX27_008634 [Mortierella sp. AM989]|nr:hypothetical protein BGX27_008634 [Mortierella sp. AM989]
MRYSTVAFVGIIFAPALAAAKTFNIDIVDYKFDPAELVINAGDEVIWNSKAYARHDVVQGSSCKSGGIFASTTISNGGKFSHTFNQAGTYPYFCTPHCSSRMEGKITVK